MELLPGFEPGTSTLPRWCSTYWAITACIKFWVIFANFLVSFRSANQVLPRWCSTTEPHQHSLLYWRNKLYCLKLCLSRYFFNEKKKLRQTISLPKFLFIVDFVLDYFEFFEMSESVFHSPRTSLTFVA